MIIELQNFGPIKSFKFDTSKDMHAIFGKNNIGKSYAISAVYLILKGLREFDNDSVIPFGNETQILERLIEQRITNEQNSTCIINDGVINLFKKSLDSSFLIYFTNSLKNTFEFGNIQNIRTLDILRISINLDKYFISIYFDKEKNVFVTDEFDFSFDYKVQVSEIEKYPKNFGNSIVYYINSSLKIIPGLDSIIFNLHRAIRVGMYDSFEEIYFLPASRSGLYNALNSFGAIFAELSRNRSFLTRKIEIPSIAEPISDYFLNLNTIDKAQANEHYLKHFEEIEQEILKGKITLDNDSKKYYYVPNDTDMRLELSFTSSMISEIAPIIAHLKYIIPLESDKPSILFIEEPEAHLHPEIQILLIEYFVKLCKGKVKIVMTSHSNYIFNKLSNLLIDKKIDSDKLSVMLMKMTPEGSVIDDGAMHIDEYGIEDNNFVDVAEQLYEERMSLLEKS